METQCGARQSTLSVLQDEIKRTKRRLEALDVLEERIDWGIMEKREEEMLWEFFASGRFI